MLAAIFLILLVVVGLIIMAILLSLSSPPSVLTYYYGYPSPQVVQEGSFGVDPVVTSTRYMEIFSNTELTHKVGTFNTVGTYTSYPVAPLMTYLKKGIVSLDNGDNFNLENWMQYSSSPPAKPTSIDFTVSFITSSNRTNYIGKKFNVTPVREGVYKLEIGL